MNSKVKSECEDDSKIGYMYMQKKKEGGEKGNKSIYNLLSTLKPEKN